MTERTIYLDPDRRDWRSRKIQVRPHRWYATVRLDRDGHVDAATRLGHDPELPIPYTEAVDKARSASIDRIWYDGYSGDFSWGNGPRWVTMFVPFPYVETTVEALRGAELDHDYSKLHALADRLGLPIDDWLAPGERELIRGVDFDPPLVLVQPTPDRKTMDMDDHARRVVLPVLDALAGYETGAVSVTGLQASAAGAASALDNANADLRAALQRLDCDLEKVIFATPEEEERTAVAMAVVDLRQLLRLNWSESYG